MEPARSDIRAIEETVVFLDYFKELPDPRQAGKVIYPLAEVLLLCLLAVLAGAESFVDIARFGEKKIEFLRRFRPFHHGTPAHDHLGDIFAICLLKTLLIFLAPGARKSSSNPRWRFDARDWRARRAA